MGLQAGAVGNHEFDRGYDWLADPETHGLDGEGLAGWPSLGANVGGSEPRRLDRGHDRVRRQGRSRGRGDPADPHPGLAGRHRGPDLRRPDRRREHRGGAAEGRTTSPTSWCCSPTRAPRTPTARRPHRSRRLRRHRQRRLATTSTRSCSGHTHAKYACDRRRPARAADRPVRRRPGQARHDASTPPPTTSPRSRPARSSTSAPAPRPPDPAVAALVADAVADSRTSSAWCRSARSTEDITRAKNAGRLARTAAASPRSATSSPTCSCRPPRTPRSRRSSRS